MNGQNEEEVKKSGAEEQAEVTGEERFKDDKFYQFAKGRGMMNLPNKLTLSRVIMKPFFVLFFYVGFTAHFFVALAVFAVASLTDLFDGKIARKYGLVTNLGKFLDPIADKVLVASAFIVLLTVPQVFILFAGEWALIAAGCGVAVILAREIIISGFRMVAAGENLVIAADKFGKYKTVFQDASIVVLLISAGLIELALESTSEALYTAAQAVNIIGLILFAVAIVLTVLSGINYIVKNIQVLKK